MDEPLWSNAPATPPTFADITRACVLANRMLRPPPRDVFVFQGTLEQFKAELGLQGVPTLVPDPSQPTPWTFYGLQIFERLGMVWIAANWKDVDDAWMGKLPIKVLGRDRNQ